MSTTVADDCSMQPDLPGVELSERGLQQITTRYTTQRGAYGDCYDRHAREYRKTKQDTEWLGWAKEGLRRQ